MQPSEGKGITAEAEAGCMAVSCWVVREYLPDCHKITL